MLVTREITKLSEIDPKRDEFEFFTYAQVKGFLKVSLNTLKSLVRSGDFPPPINLNQRQIDENPNTKPMPRFRAVDLRHWYDHRARNMTKFSYLFDN